MGWAERTAREAAEAKAGLSCEPREKIAGFGPSPWLEEQLRQFGGALIHASNQLAQIMDPPRVLGPAGQVPKIDPMRAILTNQILIMRALSAMNDAVLVLTTGKGVLEPIRKPVPPNGEPQA